MQDFTNSVIAATGLDSAIAKPAVGHVLLFLRDKAPQSHVAEFIDTMPQAHEAVAAAAATGDDELTQIIGGLTSFIGNGHADVNILAGKLIKLGLNEGQIRTLVNEVLSHAEELIGADGVREIQDELPVLAERSGQEALLSARVPGRAPIAAPRDEGAAMQASQTERVPEPLQNGTLETETRTYQVREAVGVFDDPDSLEETINLLGNSGFPVAAISVLAPQAAGKNRLGRIYRNLKEIEESSTARRTDFVSTESRAEGLGALFGIPFYIGGAAGLWAVTATGGSLALAIAAALGLGSLGAGLGAVLAGAIERHHLEKIEEQLKLGGLVLWVTTPSAEAEKRALTILRKAGARDVHVHEIQREWSMKSIPLTDGPYDPFVGLLGESVPEKRSA